MKKFLFVSQDSLSGDLAYKLVTEGHEVKIYFKDETSKDVYDGFLNKVTSWIEEIDWADVIIFDDENFGKEADKLRGKGKLVIGGSKYTDKLEIDRHFGQRELSKFGIAILPCTEFKSYEKALEFIEKNKGKYVFKTTGKDQPEEKSLVYISKEDNGKDLAEFISSNALFLKTNIPKFVLQQYVEGVEVAVGAFFNGKDFIRPINVNFEHKKMFPDNLGPMTGEMGTMMFWTKTNKIFNETLLKLKDSLKRSNYVGYIDLNCIVNESGIYPLEFTSRFGYPTIQIQLEGIVDKAGDWLFNLASGRNFTLQTKEGFQIGVVVCTPPLLSEGRDKDIVNLYRGLGIFNLPRNTEKIHLGDVKKDLNGVWRVAGTSGWTLVVTGSGKSVIQAQNRAYKLVKQINIPNLFYRNDIGNRWKTDKKKLKKWKYLT